MKCLQISDWNSSIACTALSTPWTLSQQFVIRAYAHFTFWVVFEGIGCWCCSNGWKADSWSGSVWSGASLLSVSRMANLWGRRDWLGKVALKVLCSLPTQRRTKMRISKQVHNICGSHMIHTNQFAAFRLFMCRVHPYDWSASRHDEIRGNDWLCKILGISMGATPR